MTDGKATYKEMFAIIPGKGRDGAARDFFQRMGVAWVNDNSPRNSLTLEFDMYPAKPGTKVVLLDPEPKRSATFEVPEDTKDL